MGCLTKRQRQSPKFKQTNKFQPRYQSKFVRNNASPRQTRQTYASQEAHRREQAPRRQEARRRPSADSPLLTSSKNKSTSYCIGGRAVQKAKNIPPSVKASSQKRRASTSSIGRIWGRRRRRRRSPRQSSQHQSRLRKLWSHLRSRLVVEEVLGRSWWWMGTEENEDLR